MDAGGQTPGGLPFWCRELLQDLAGQAEGRSCQLHGQKHHALALQERQLQQITSHPHNLVAQGTLQIDITGKAHSDLADTCAEDASVKPDEEYTGPTSTLALQRATEAKRRRKCRGGQ